MGTVMRALNRSVNERNSVLSRPANEGFAMELTSVVEMNDIREPMDRPIGLDAPILEPRSFRQDQLLNGERDRRRRGALQTDVETRHHPAGNIDRQCQPRSLQRATMNGIDDK
jgi:hypothetical protein